MMYNFCTLFDSGYLDRGLVAYYSLKEHCTNFHIYMVAFDEIAFKCLNKLQLKYCTVLLIDDIENDELRRIKKERSHTEYCWTCASYITFYVMENMQVDHCTYIDADLMFYANPEKLVDELLVSGGSVQIVGHNFPDTKKYRRMSQKLGKYCVQFNTFMNDEKGKKVLREWMFSCIQQCSEKNDGKSFGDQKYLDNWERDYEGVHVLENRGGGVAPWNIGEYVLAENGKELLIRDQKSGEVFPLVFYHYHAFRECGRNKIDMSSVRRHKKTDLHLLYILYGSYIYELDKVRTLLSNECAWSPAIPHKRKKKKLKDIVIDQINYVLFSLEIICGGWRDFVVIDNIKKFARGKNNEGIS